MIQSFQNHGALDWLAAPSQQRIATTQLRIEAPRTVKPLTCAMVEFGIECTGTVIPRYLTDMFACLNRAPGSNSRQHSVIICQQHLFLLEGGVGAVVAVVDVIVVTCKEAVETVLI
jgi:hypothetical protein